MDEAATIKAAWFDLLSGLYAQVARLQAALDQAERDLKAAKERASDAPIS